VIVIVHTASSARGVPFSASAARAAAPRPSSWSVDRDQVVLVGTIFVIVARILQLTEHAAGTDEQHRHTGERRQDVVRWLSRRITVACTALVPMAERSWLASNPLAASSPNTAPAIEIAISSNGESEKME